MDNALLVPVSGLSARCRCLTVSLGLHAPSPFYLDVDKQGDDRADDGPDPTGGLDEPAPVMERRRPRNPPTNEPITPNRIVWRIVIDCLPGTSARAMKPAKNPMITRPTMVPNMSPPARQRVVTWESIAGPPDEWWSEGRCARRQRNRASEATDGRNPTICRDTHSRNPTARADVSGRFPGPLARPLSPRGRSLTRSDRRLGESCNETPPATPADTATATPPPRGCSTPAAPTSTAALHR